MSEKTDNMTLLDKYQVKILLAAILIICNIMTYGQIYEELDCIDQNLDKYDVEVHEVTIKGVTTEKEYQIDKCYKSFKPCRRMSYATTYLTKRNELIILDTVLTFATGRRWKAEPNLQNELKIIYQNKDDATKTMLEEHNVNKGKSLDWISEVTEGIVENSKKVWMHPFRYHHYQFTEVAPFPKIKLPASIGNKWTVTVYGYSGWGDWDDSQTKSKYKIEGKENVDIRIGTLTDCWKIKAKSKNSKAGKSKLIYWYHEHYGFVKLEYTNFRKQKLIIELVETKSK